MTLRLTAARSNQLSYGSRSAESGIRTHEADARDLKTRPFDRSGIPAERLSIIGYKINIGELLLDSLRKCSMRGLNSRPTRYKHVALPTELMELKVILILYLMRDSNPQSQV